MGKKKKRLSLSTRSENLLRVVLRRKSLTALFELLMFLLIAIVYLDVAYTQAVVRSTRVLMLMRHVKRELSITGYAANEGLTRHLGMNNCPYSYFTNSTAEANHKFCALAEPWEATAFFTWATEKKSRASSRSCPVKIEEVKCHESMIAKAKEENSLEREWNPPTELWDAKQIKSRKAVKWTNEYVPGCAGSHKSPMPSYLMTLKNVMAPRMENTTFMERFFNGTNSKNKLAFSSELVVRCPRCVSSGRADVAVTDPSKIRRCYSRTFTLREGWPLKFRYCDRLFLIGQREDGSDAC